MEERMREVALLSRARSLSTPFLRPSPSLVSNLDPFGYKRGREIAALADPLTHPMLSGEIISAGARASTWRALFISYRVQGWMSSDTTSPCPPLMQTAMSMLSVSSPKFRHRFICKTDPDVWIALLQDFLHVFRHLTLVN